MQLFLPLRPESFFRIAALIGFHWTVFLAAGLLLPEQERRFLFHSNLLLLFWFIIRSTDDFK
jgi:hypothetical protein